MWNWIGSDEEDERAVHDTYGQYRRRITSACCAEYWSKYTVDERK